MAKKKDDKIAADAIFANGAHFNVIQLPRDVQPQPASQRIIQMVNRNGFLKCYVSENAFCRAELLEILYSLIRQGYATSISRGAANLHPIKGKIHWCEFTEDFCKTGKGMRIDPEKDEAENILMPSEEVH